MAKAQGIIGNFKGKIGNTVGYQLTSSNNKQTQGIRIYQPNVKNPKSSGQAEQRAKLAPINATYRALKMVIDRGNEGLPYGNKSRLAWLKQAFKAEHMPWIEKGAVIGYPVGCHLTKGSLPGVQIETADDEFFIVCSGVKSESTLATFGAVSTAMKTAYPSLQDGDQITIVIIGQEADVLASDIFSFVIDPTSTVATDRFGGDANKISVGSNLGRIGGAVIVSREGANGEHLRSTTMLEVNEDTLGRAPYNEVSKTAAIKSYMSSGAANTDWEQEPID